MKRIFALMLLAVGFTTSAHADFIPATWTDSANVSTPITQGESFTYTHDLIDRGFRPSLDHVDEFTLSIDLANGSWNLGTIQLPDVFDGRILWDFGSTSVETGSSWSLLGLLELNTLGTLTVTITSVLGNFNLVGSNLTATGEAYTAPASVPEPGALGLLGVGLLGMAISMRRRKQTNR